MVVKLFVLGHPGSGKSTIARHIVDHVAQEYKGWSARHVNDYDILYKMFQSDTSRKRFHRTKHDGFLVHDRSAYDEALKKVEEKVKQLCTSETELAIIEFARNDYREALRQFSPDFVLDAYFFFLDVNIDTCIKRIHKRVAHPTTPDDHFVSRKLFKFYHNQQIKQYIAAGLKADYGIDEQRVRIIDNRGSDKDGFQNSYREAKQFIDFILTKKVSV